MTEPKNTIFSVLSAALSIGVKSCPVLLSGCVPPTEMTAQPVTPTTIVRKGSMVDEAIVRAVNKFNEKDNATYKALMKATIREALGLNGDPEEVDLLERKIEALNKKMLDLVNESVQSGEGIEAHESEFISMSQEVELLRQRIAAIQELAIGNSEDENRIDQIQTIIAERENNRMKYDDTIVRQMIECIKVYPDGKLEIFFGGGYLIEEAI